MTVDAWTQAAQQHERLRKIAEAAEAFVRKHCELETLAHEIGAYEAAETPLHDEVIALHVQLEVAVLGDEHVPGRRAPCP